MEQLQKLPESKMKIRFPDCDPFNHLNNSRYIDYFLNAREDHLLASYGFDLYKLAIEKGVGWVVAQNQVAYLSPATLMETVTIQTHLLAYDDKSLLMEGLMWNENKTILRSVLWATFVHFDLKTQRSSNHNAELMELFGEVTDPLPGKMTFEERIRNLKV